MTDEKKPVTFEEMFDISSEELERREAIRRDEFFRKLDEQRDAGLIRGVESDEDELLRDPDRLTQMFKDAESRFPSMLPTNFTEKVMAYIRQRTDNEEEQHDEPST